MQRPLVDSKRKGLTLVELAVVIVIIGVLAAFGVPRFRQSVEKSKAEEAFNYLSAVQSAQERYIDQNGVYADAVSRLDINLPAPQYFDNPSAITVTSSTSGSPSWSLTLTRNSNASYEYTVVWKETGFDSTNSTITTYPAICPVTVSGSTNQGGG
jgi:prepilin-type N-terminal cleavage/methylation domain-containing protein